MTRLRKEVKPAMTNKVGKRVRSEKSEKQTASALPLPCGERAGGRGEIINF
jgi:hypothetical protein